MIACPFLGSALASEVRSRPHDGGAEMLTQRGHGPFPSASRLKLRLGVLTRSVVDAVDGRRERVVGPRDLARGALAVRS